MEADSENVIHFDRGSNRCVEQYSHRFKHPDEVKCDPNLDLREIRVILASLGLGSASLGLNAYDASSPETISPVTVSSIPDALGYVDCPSGAANDDDLPPSPKSRL